MSQDHNPLPPTRGEGQGLTADTDDATELLEIVTSRAADFSRKAADDLYSHLLEATQDYLIDNARFNIGQRICAAERQARHDREAWGKAEARVRGLLETIRAVRAWADKRCPCGPPDYAYDEPKICPLCQADRDKPGDGCRAAPETFPRELLRKMDHALQTTEPKSSPHPPGANSHEG